jgi:hypothetical protein
MRFRGNRTWRRAECPSCPASFALAALTLLAALALAAAPVASAQSRDSRAASNPFHGKLSGIVTDASGIPQMGASVAIVPESALSGAARDLITNDRGLFSADVLLPGFYTVRVSLAGFLPVLERNVRVDSSLTTLLKIELDNVFASIDRLRRSPGAAPAPDDWTWILRTSAATRPVLRWVDGEVVLALEHVGAAERPARTGANGRLELTSGAGRPGSPSNVADAPASTFAYEVELGRMSRLLLAGQMSYEKAVSSGFAAMWLPAGENGPRSTLVLRQAQLSPDGMTFRGLRSDHQNEVALSERVVARYGAELISVGLGRSATSFRPRGEVEIGIGRDWRVSLLSASRPWAGASHPETSLETVTDQLDAFPAVMLAGGRPVIEGGRHEEIGLERRLGQDASLEAAVFHDRSRHTAVFGRGRTASADFLQDFFSGAFVYDGGDLASWGARLAYRQKLGAATEVGVIYAWAGALAPELTAYPASSRAAGSPALRDQLDTSYRHSIAARVRSRVPALGTRLTASYKWISGPVASRQDAFGEVAYQVDPYLNLTVRQPMPSLLGGSRIEALADFRNLLAQGYVPVSTADGTLILIPSLRSFRGGFSFQF